MERLANTTQKALLVASAFLATTCPGFALAQGPSTVEKIKQSGVINLGHRDASVPFSYVGPDGKPIGYSVDICLRIVDGLKRELKLTDIRVNWLLVSGPNRVADVRDGRVDIECGNTTVTAERRKLVDFTVPVFVAGSGVMVRADRGVTEFSQLKGKRVAFVQGTTGEKLVEQANRTRDLLLIAAPMRSNDEAFDAIRSGSVDAWVTDDIILSAYRALNGMTESLVLLERRHSIEPLALMYRRDEQDFAKLVDREILKSISGGDVQALYQKWFQGAVPPRGTSLEVPPSRYLRETWRFPTKLEAQIDLLLL